MGNSISYYTLRDNERQYYDCAGAEDGQKYFDNYMSERLNIPEAGYRKILQNKDDEWKTRYARRLYLPKDVLTKFEAPTVSDMNLGEYINNENVGDISSYNQITQTTKDVSNIKYNKRKNEIIIHGNFNFQYTSSKPNENPGNISPFITTTALTIINKYNVERMKNLMNDTNMYNLLINRFKNLVYNNPKLRLIHNIYKQHQTKIQEEFNKCSYIKYNLYDIPIGPMLTINPVSAILNYKNILGEYKFIWQNKNDVFSKTRESIVKNNFYDYISNVFVNPENICIKYNSDMLEKKYAFGISLPIDSAAFLSFMYENITPVYNTKVESFEVVLNDMYENNKNYLIVSEQKIDSVDVSNEFKSLVSKTPIEIKVPVLTIYKDEYKFNINFTLNDMYIYWDTNKMNVELRGNYLYISYPDKHNIALTEVQDDGPGFLNLNEF